MINNKTKARNSAGENKMDKSKALKVGALVVASALVGAGLTAIVNHNDVSLEQANKLIAEAQSKAAEKAFAEGKASVVIPEPVDVKAIESKAFADGVASVKPVVLDASADKVESMVKVIFENDGNVEFLTEDVKEKDMAQIGDAAVMAIDFRALALEEVKSSIKKLADDEVVSGVTLDKGDIDRVKVHDDSGDVTIDSFDFEDRDATLLVTGTFEQDDVKYEFEVSVEIRDGEVDDSSLESLDLA